MNGIDWNEGDSVMSQKNYKVTITEHGYEYTKYIAWVSATSKNQAMVKAAALAGQEKSRREFERTGKRLGVVIEGLMDPEVRLEAADLEEYWAHREEVTVECKAVTDVVEYVTLEPLE